MRTNRKLLLACLYLSAFVLSGHEHEAQAAPALPDSWVNSPGFTNEALAGKVVFLVFYEET